MAKEESHMGQRRPEHSPDVSVYAVALMFWTQSWDDVPKQSDRTREETERWCEASMPDEDYLKRLGVSGAGSGIRGSVELAPHRLKSGQGRKKTRQKQANTAGPSLLAQACPRQVSASYLIIMARVP